MDFTSFNSLKAITNCAEKRLRRSEIQTSRLEAEVLLLGILKKDRLWLYKNWDYTLERKYPFLHRYIKHLKRRCNGEPLAHILGYREFYGRFFAVNSNTLIPRPESEELVEHTLKLAPLTEKSLVLDLCCGSGCLGLSILLERPKINLHLSDISDLALEVCHSNATKLLTSKIRNESLRYSIYCSDLFEQLPGENYDLIVCNPPYVLADEYNQLDDQVRKYEPCLALLCAEPETFYQRILQGISKHLVLSSGLALLELNPRLMPLCLEIASTVRLKGKILQDLSQRNRFLLLKHN